MKFNAALVKKKLTHDPIYKKPLYQHFENVSLSWKNPFFNLKRNSTIYTKTFHTPFPNRKNNTKKTCDPHIPTLSRLPLTRPPPPPLRQLFTPAPSSCPSLAGEPSVARARTRHTTKISYPARRRRRKESNTERRALRVLGIPRAKGSHPFVVYIPDVQSTERDSSASTPRVPRCIPPREWASLCSFFLLVLFFSIVQCKDGAVMMIGVMIHLGGGWAIVSFTPVEMR